MSPSAAQAISDELRALRRQPGDLTPNKLVSAPVIVKGLGGNDPEIALDRLLLLAHEHADDPDVDAAMFVMGRGATGNSVLDRHNEWAAAHFVDERTARRHTDNGIRKLVALIMGPAPWLQPTATQELWQEADMVVVRFLLRLPPTVTMGPFEVEIDGVAQRVDFDREDRTAHPRSYRSNSRILATAASGTVTLAMRWRGEKTANYCLVVRPEVKAQIESRIVRWEMRTILRGVKND